MAKDRVAAAACGLVAGIVIGFMVGRAPTGVPEVEVQRRVDEAAKESAEKATAAAWKEYEALPLKLTRENCVEVFAKADAVMKPDAERKAAGGDFAGAASAYLYTVKIMEEALAKYERASGVQGAVLAPSHEIQQWRMTVQGWKNRAFEWEQQAQR